jgi:hypothetical protein
MKNILFTTAVLLAVGELRQSGSFSYFDVTKKLRDQVNQGQVAFSDRDLEDVDGVSTYRVDHNEVKTIFNDLWENDVIVNLDKSYTGRYWQFSNTTTSVASAPNNAVATSTSVTAAVRNPTQDPLSQQIVNYLRSRVGQPTTMKQIQSRCKGVNKTCGDYANLVIKLGYIVSNAHLPVSQQTV